MSTASVRIVERAAGAAPDPGIQLADDEAGLTVQMAAAKHRLACVQDVSRALECAW